LEKIVVGLRSALGPFPSFSPDHDATVPASMSTAGDLSRTPEYHLMILSCPVNARFSISGPPRAVRQSRLQPDLTRDPCFAVSPRPLSFAPHPRRAQQGTPSSSQPPPHSLALTIFKATPPTFSSYEHDPLFCHLVSPCRTSVSAPSPARSLKLTVPLSARPSLPRLGLRSHVKLTAGLIPSSSSPLQMD
jgi:hypothetical protein